MSRYGEESPDAYELLDSARRELDDAYDRLRQGGTLEVGARRPRRRGVNWWYVATGVWAAVVIGFLAGLTVGSADEPPPAARPQVATGPTDEPGDPAGGPAPSDPAGQAPEPSGPSPEPTTASPEPAPAPGPFIRSDGEGPDDGGTLGNPFPTGAPVSNGEWEVTLGEPREAWGEIREENSLNDPPATGMQFWIVPVTATYLGEGPARMADLKIHFAGSDKEVYVGSCGVVPDSVDRVAELYEGGTAEGNDCLEVPAGADGLWALRPDWDTAPVYFDAS